MSLFKKKKKPLFGGSVTPNCVYCRNNGGAEGSVVCTAGGEFKKGVCKKYVYDPLMRKPNTQN